MEAGNAGHEVSRRILRLQKLHAAAEDEFAGRQAVEPYVERIAHRFDKAAAQGRADLLKSREDDAVAYPFNIMVQNLTITDNDNPENVQTFPDVTYKASDVINSLSQGRGVLCLLPLNTPITYPRSCTITGTITAVQTAAPVS